ncbi:hypothetical protein BDF22DRAFT_351132 [Syncephalis plumigaleata]|nr:hypothetical protein BDF22DRAFT_351132 [Syncephalis plumigaleata]
MASPDHGHIPHAPLCRIYSDISTCSYPTGMFVVALTTASIAGIGCIIVGMFISIRLQRRHKPMMVAEQVALFFAIHIVERFCYWVLIITSVLKEYYIVIYLLSNMGWLPLIFATFTYLYNIIVACPQPNTSAIDLHARSRRISYILKGVAVFILFLCLAISLTAGILRDREEHLHEMIVMQAMLCVFGATLISVAAAVWHFGLRLQKLARQRTNVLNQFGDNERRGNTASQQRYRQGSSPSIDHGILFHNSHARLRSLNQFLIPIGIIYGIALMVAGSFGTKYYEQQQFSVPISAIVNSGNILAIVIAELWLTISFYRQYKQECMRSSRTLEDTSTHTEHASVPLTSIDALELDYSHLLPLNAVARLNGKSNPTTAAINAG